MSKDMLHYKMMMTEKTCTGNCDDILRRVYP